MNLSGKCQIAGTAEGKKEEIGYAGNLMRGSKFEKGGIRAPG